MSAFIDQRALSKTRAKAVGCFDSAQKKIHQSDSVTADYTYQAPRQFCGNDDQFSVIVYSGHDFPSLPVARYLLLTDGSLESSLDHYECESFQRYSSGYYYKSGESSSSSALRGDSSNSAVHLYFDKIYLLESNKRHRAASKVIFSFIERQFFDSNLADVKIFLSEINLEQLSVWSISGLFRVTARAKQQFPEAWYKQFRNANEILHKRGVNVASLFAGL